MKSVRVNKTAIAILIGTFMLSGFVIAGRGVEWGNPFVGDPDAVAQQQNNNKKPEKAIVDYIADVVKKIKEDTITRLVGNVVFHHNGAIIQCDSALQYDDKRMDCFGNVIINQDSTYIYGDMVTYDGNVDLATVHAPIIKITNGKETVMYTYKLTFNTLTSIGEFSGGGIVQQRDNFMEAQRGIYNSNTNEIKLYNEVSMRNPDYVLKTDSLKFDLNTEVTTFLTKTYIWDKERDFLTSQSGTYERASQTYTFTEKAYILTPDQEVWADSIIYHSLTKEAVLRRNIQILDTAQKTLAFGDWGYYNDSIKKAILSRQPSVRSWEEKGDTAYLRADSIYFETFPRGTTKAHLRDSLGSNGGDTNGNELITESPVMQNPIQSLESDHSGLVRKGIDSLSQETDMGIIDIPREITGITTDSLDHSAIPKHEYGRHVTDSLTNNSETVNKHVDIKTYPKDAAISRYVSEVLTTVETENSDVRPDSITDAIDEVISDSSIRDSVKAMISDSLSYRTDSLGNRILSDSSLLIPKPKKEQDTTERLIRAFRNVRSFRKDFQTACDSLVSYSVDTTLTMFGSPILWNENNQITADQIDVYSKDEHIDWADFIGNPFVVQRVDSVNNRYNQAKGRSMKAYFKDNEIDMTSMRGNVLNYYYWVEDDQIVGFATMESAELEMYFTKREPSKMKWIGQGDWAIYPIEQIPSEQSQTMEGFCWITEGRARDFRDICKRKELPSSRKEVEAYTKPEFKLEAKINAHKEQLLKEGKWRDRVDMPIFTAEYFKTDIEQ